MTRKRPAGFLLLALGAACCESAPPGASGPAPLPDQATTSSARAPASAAPRVKVDPADDRKWDSSIKLFETFADLVDEHQDDCAKLAVAIEKFVADHRKTMLELKAHEQGLPDEEKRELERKYGKRADKADARIQRVMRKCGSNAKVRKAMDSMPLQ